MDDRHTSRTDADRAAEYCLPADGPGTKTTDPLFFEFLLEVEDELAEDAADADEAELELLLDDPPVPLFDGVTVPEFK